MTSHPSVFMMPLRGDGEFTSAAGVKRIALLDEAGDAIDLAGMATGDVAKSTSPLDRGKTFDAYTGLPVRITTPINLLDYVVGTFTKNTKVPVNLAQAVADAVSAQKPIYIPNGLFAVPTTFNITIPAGAINQQTLGLYGEGAQSRIYLPDGMVEGDYLLRYNENADDSPVLTNFQKQLAFFERFYVLGNNSPAGGFARFYNRNFYAKSVNLSGIGHGFVTDGYTDTVMIEDAYASSIAAGGYYFEQRGNGDAIAIDSMTNYRCGGVYIQNARAVLLRNVVSGFHRFRNCSSVDVLASHLEGDGTNDPTPLFLVQNTKIDFHSGEIMTNSHRPAIEVDDHLDGGVGSRVSIRKGMNFLQRLDIPTGTPGPGSDAVPTGHHDALQGVALHIVGGTAPTRMRIELEEIRQYYFCGSYNGGTDGNLDLISAIKISADDVALQTALDARASLLLGRVSIENNASTWEVNAPHPLQGIRTARRAASSPSLSGVVSAATGWKDATVLSAGTYFYKVSTRDAEGFTTTASAEVSNTVDGTNPVSELRVTNVHERVVLCVWRGDASGVYNRYIEIPISKQSPILRDQGSHIGGQVWQTTGIPTPPTNNNTRDAIVHIRGSRIIWGSTRPTQGTHSTGDVCLNTSGSGPFGWRCISSGTPGTWSTIGDERLGVTANTTMLGDFTVIGVTALAASKTVTLPAANAIPAGRMFLVKDETGLASTTTKITVAAAGADTIEGVASKDINVPFGFLRVYSNGVDKYLVA